MRHIITTPFIDFFQIRATLRFEMENSSLSVACEISCHLLFIHNTLFRHLLLPTFLYRNFRKFEILRKQKVKDYLLIE